MYQVDAEGKAIIPENKPKKKGKRKTKEEGDEITEEVKKAAEAEKPEGGAGTAGGQGAPAEGAPAEPQAETKKEIEEEGARILLNKGF